jgi:hypothetical protein
MRHLTAVTPKQLAEAILKFPQAVSWLVYKGESGSASLLLFDKDERMIADISNIE